MKRVRYTGPLPGWQGLLGSATPARNWPGMWHVKFDQARDWMVMPGVHLQLVPAVQPRQLEPVDG